jgi:hypothetical protein
MAIERLSLLDTVTASTYFAVNVNNQDYRTAASTVAEYINSQGSSGDGKIIQYAGPTGTGFTVTITDSSASTWLVLTPNATLAAGTIILPNVEQYDPTRKKWIKNDDPTRFLKEHILKGDAGDGVPNVLSDDDTFVTAKRQKPMTAKRIEELLKATPDKDYDEKVYKNFLRNRELIDLSNTPDYIREQVLNQFTQQNGKDRSKLLNYFIANKMKNLTEHLSEF